MTRCEYIERFNDNESQRNYQGYEDAFNTNRTIIDKLDIIEFMNLSCSSSTVINPNENFWLLVVKEPLLALEALALLSVILLTVGGNTLVIAAIASSPSLRAPTHSLIVNLACADLILGLTVLPLSASRELRGSWGLGPLTCSLWAALDVLCCTASILSLCGISVDRYIGVSRPLSYSRVVTTRRVRATIATIWLLALAISAGPPLGWAQESVYVSETRECNVNKQLGYVIFSTCGSFYLPALVILVLYGLVYRAAARRSQFLDAGAVTRSQVTLRIHRGNKLTKSNVRKDGSSTILVSRPGPPRRWASQGRGGPLCRGPAAKFRRQKKAAKTLGIVVGGFLLCWFPFFVILPIDAACESCNLSESAIFTFAFWLGYFNSCINPFIYACSSRELRRAFQSILRRAFSLKLRKQRSAPNSFVPPIKHNTTANSDIE
ncbi:alpha-1A adrenergic receptor [Cephus cinctus]|uniref:Alpha-1A adrenergic receptor n=1 Tax=Cephus cinctus TaxID=211228 RepID=A0AAJ7C0A7_CEPCN|nr:alpha-1A adrenergic receptor [Cephus cinctus]XP_015598850.1 alpha-1A adrenergic receptor [Cephus cinctus]XP_015598851.1 alpha-1A adrenergic receptor [Cephus cinctus]XP_024942576.1 alpha-1A adrenergic receptor [Cephus cinctus]